MGNLGAGGIPEDHLLILLRVAVPDNGSVSGGKPASEVNIGCNINV